MKTPKSPKGDCIAVRLFSPASLKASFRGLGVVLLLFSMGLSVFSQAPKKWEYSYTYRYWGVRDGLAQSQVFKSFQDSYGYLWFSTNDGVSRFDGLRFENFSQADLRINGRMKYFNQYESAVYMVSPDNIVFVYPDRHMEYFPLPDNYQTRDEEIEVSGNCIYLFNCYHSTQGVQNRFSLFRFDLKSKTFTKLADDLPFLFAYVSEQKVYAVKGWEIHNHQLTLYRIDGDRLQSIQTVPMEKADLYVEFRKTKRNDWFARLVKGSEPHPTAHIYRCFVENDSLRWDYLTPMVLNELKCMEHWDEHRFLAGIHLPEHSAFVLDTIKRNIAEFPLSTIMVNDILVDRDDNVWFSTEDGVYQCPRSFFESCRLGLGHNDNLWGVIKDSQGSVWFSSFTFGLWRTDAQGNLYPAKTVYHQKDLPVQMGYMSNCEDSRGRIFQTCNNGIAVFDPSQGNPNRLEISQTGTSMAVYPDKETGNVYFGGDSAGIHRTLNVLHANGDLSTYPFGTWWIISICRDGAGKLRLGAFYGEARLDEEKQTVVFDTVKRPYDGVIAMDLDEQGILWKGTTQGLFAEDRQGNNRKISDEMVNFVLQYRNRYIIYGVREKLYLLDLPAYHRDSTVSIRAFGFYDGFDLMECGQNGASIDSEGYVWIAGGDKVIRFLPDKIMQTPLLQPVAPYLAAIYNAGKNSEWTIVKKDSSMEFDNNSNYLRFDLLQASVPAPEKLIFRYKLNGYNKEWTVSRDRSFIFQNLPFGKFRLELQSSFDDGQQWSKSVFSPEITIRNPFLLTVPGLALIFFAIAAVTAFIIYFTRKISIRKEEEKRMIDQLKHKAVQAKFIPHFTGNVLNSINYLITKNPDLAQQYISDFAGFSYDTLLTSDTLYRTIQSEVDYSLLYLKLEKLRFEEKLEYDVSIDPVVDMQKPVPTMVLQTFCENAIKHGLRPKPEGGKISIHIYQEMDYVALAVEDNGIGREKARALNTEGTGEGLKIVQQQLDIFNKNRTKKAYLHIVDLLDEAGNPSGTRFELRIPL